MKIPTRGRLVERNGTIRGSPRYPRRCGVLKVALCALLMQRRMPILAGWVDAMCRSIRRGNGNPSEVAAEFVAALRPDVIVVNGTPGPIQTPKPDPRVRNGRLRKKVSVHFSHTCSPRFGRFLWPSNVEPGGTLMLNSAQLSMLIDGVDWRAPERQWRPAVAG